VYYSQSETTAKFVSLPTEEYEVWGIASGKFCSSGFKGTEPAHAPINLCKL